MFLQRSLWSDKWSISFKLLFHHLNLSLKCILSLTSKCTSPIKDLPRTGRACWGRKVLHICWAIMCHLYHLSRFSVKLSEHKGKVSPACPPFFNSQRRVQAETKITLQTHRKSSCFSYEMVVQFSVPVTSREVTDSKRRKWTPSISFGRWTRKPESVTFNTGTALKDYYMYQSCAFQKTPFSHGWRDISEYKGGIQWLLQSLSSTYETHLKSS